MNLTIMKLDLALREDEPAKLSDSSTPECCLMIIRYHMEESIHDGIEGVDVAKNFLESIDKNFKKFSKNERNEHLNMLHNISYDGASGIRSHIDKAISCYRKLLSIGAKLLDDDYRVWLFIRTLPPQFDAIRSSYNAQKEQWSLKEMTSILAKEEDDIKNGRGRSVSFVSNLEQSSQKKNFPHKHFSKQFKKKPASGKPNAHTGVQSSGTKKDSFPGKCNFCHKFGHKKAECKKNGKVAMYSDSLLIGNRILCDSLYKVDLFQTSSIHSSSSSLVNTVMGLKRSRLDEKSSMLWHRRLGHISRQRIERLAKDGLLQNLNFTDFDTCIDCIKGKLTTKVRKSKTDRCKDVLEIIHIDICGTFSPPAIKGYRYFITFIDDFSRYGYVELICDKSDSLEVFKAFKTKVELQKGKKIKVVNSDRGGEYYDRYDETGCNPGPFANFLQECGI
ncbi:hypothetical protein UlMin_013641 [Ulmus minor]